MTLFKRSSILLSNLIFLLISLTACGGNPTPGAVTPTIPNSNLTSLVGTTGKDGRFIATVTSIESTAEIQNISTKEIIRAGAGETFLIVYLNVTNEGIELGRFQVMRVIDNLKRRFYPAKSISGKQAESATAFRIGRQAQISPGSSGKDFVIFEVPLDLLSVPFEFEFGPDNE